MINYRNINHEWQFSSEQEQVLQRYYDANKLLLDCLLYINKLNVAISQSNVAQILAKALDEQGFYLFLPKPPFNANFTNY